MTNEQLTVIREEIRADYQIPPYTADGVIDRSVRKCAARLESLKPGADFEDDIIARGHLKEYVYYDMVHRGEEFLQNYGPDIRAWQLSEEVAEE